MIDFCHFYTFLMNLEVNFCTEHFLLLSESECSELKNVNSWKISVGDSWIPDIYGNLKTFDGWWLKVKATLSRTW